ncbi:DNA-processing protein DprA [Gloeothece verrucosa]|uniref:SMF family protein n=1 Tax=Gloeothece verrucosa (strain PCC 7822) TaxID=497965 RepID=E0UHI6_GLOV7|nr:DNA-processing protein DprA [Gloeothece verrucosa]ADN12127.1 SMF family protein [Gloeothece verrucosa PCC 7822]
MNSTEYFWFRLLQTPGIGAKSLVTIAKLLQKYNLSPEKIPNSKKELSSLFPELAKIILNKIKKEDQEKIFQEYNEIEREDINLFYPQHPHYPEKLLNKLDKYGISPVLFYQGQSKLLDQTGIAVVGSRNVSVKGIEATQKLAHNLALEGINVISGYAKGVDSEAHLSALQAEGTTTLVLSYGIKEFRLKKEFNGFNFKKNILTISQFSLKTKWMARNAMARNKLVCALSQGIIVIESGPEKDELGKMSGTFNTGLTALNMNLPLFVVNPEYFEKPPQGNYDLIKKGGVKIDPEKGISQIIEHLSKLQLTIKSEPKKNVAVQTELFPIDLIAR